jgi:putative hemolysin
MTQILIVLGCLVLNAVFAAIEMAFVTIGKPELRNRAKAGELRAKSLLEMRENPEKALSVIQIGITLVGAISAAVSGAGAEESLAPIYEAKLGVSEQMSEVLAIASVVLPLTYFSVVLGELVPKSVALKYPNLVLGFGVSILKVGIRVFGPMVTVLEVSTKTVMSVLFPKKPGDLPATEPELGELDITSFSKAHRQYILNLAEIEKKQVRDIILPWANVDSISKSATFDDVLACVIRCGHTRIPVVDVEGSVSGILHSKEFLAFAAAGSQDWQSIVRNTVIVSGSDNLLGTMRRLQEQKKHMGIVYEGSSLIGIVTIEDIVEEIIGDVFDEDDDGLVRKLLASRLPTSSPKKFQT